MSLKGKVLAVGIYPAENIYQFEQKGGMPKSMEYVITAIIAVVVGVICFSSALPTANAFPKGRFPALKRKPQGSSTKR